MAPISTTIKIDPELKKQAQELFGELGMNLTTAVNIFLAQAVREQAIPFKVGMDVPNEETIAAITEGHNIIEKGNGRFDSAESMFNDLGI
jgi:DNA-damage-inducible protein J